VPESRTRKKKNARKVQQVQSVELTSADIKPNPPWFLPVLLGLMMLGLLWIVIFYVTSGGSRLPVPALGNWNLLVGFLFIMAGFIMTTRWR